MIRDELRQVIADAVQRAQADGQLPSVGVPDFVVERPANAEHGDYASSLALRMARAARMPPMTIASTIATHMTLPASVESVSVAPPGFINIHLAPAWLTAQVEAILAEGARYGAVDLGHGQRAQVEYVSANPTGPLHVGTGRGAALGDSLARVLQWAGYQVDREYYVNDAGSRMEAFNASVFARYAQRFDIGAQVPEDGYPGDYVDELAQAIVASDGRRFLDLATPEEWNKVNVDPVTRSATDGQGGAFIEVGRKGMDRLLEQIRHDLDRMNVRFDRWFSEQSLFDDGAVKRAIDALRERGYVIEREGAIWFASSALGEDRDSVLVRSNSLPTYFASDVAYHYNKLIERGYELAIDVWGADHQGHVPRMKAVVGAIGGDPSHLTVLLYQLVNLVRNGRPVAMGKRTGTFVTLREVLDEVGPDAVRFFLVARSPDAMMDFDLDLAKAQSDVNPVYYVQYAHARIASIMRRAADIDYSTGDVSLLTHDAELALIRKMLMFPEVVADAAANFAPHPIPPYAQELATAFHAFYAAHEEVADEEADAAGGSSEDSDGGAKARPRRQRALRVISEDEAMTRARLKLVASAKTILAATLDLIGVSAPEEM